MNVTYDVFRKFPDGQVWVDAVEGIENVRVRVMNRMKAEPGEYYVYDLMHKTVVLRLPEDDAVYLRNRKATER
ncbi:MAG TPA: hypothetical protein VOA41_07480 [Candidatus Dormibacteraeota bacterium]|nr:hypothetical protein [Candidatus Dormibacteraeota bacterium]